MADQASRTGTVLGHYQIGRLLGRGGMGEVYEAFDTRRDRTVALKLLSAHLADNEEYRDRFMRESRTAARLSEPHIVPIHDFGEIDGILFLDMRLVDGKDLRDAISKGPLSPSRAVYIMTQVASALDAAHRSNLVHRDVKPDNIVIDGDDFAYLVDFGIAHGPTDTRLTMTGSALGSLAYMAPERFGDEPLGPAADIYSLTCVFYESLTGAQPFGQGSMTALMTSHLTKPPPTTGGPFDPVIARGMAKDPAHRFATAKDFARAAAEALIQVPNPGQPAAYGPPPAPAPRSTSNPAPHASGPQMPGQHASGPQQPSPTPVPNTSGPQFTGPQPMRPHTSGPQHAAAWTSGPQAPSPGTPAGRVSGPQQRPVGSSSYPPTVYPPPQQPPMGYASRYGVTGPSWSPPPDPRRRRKIVIGVAALVVLALVIAGIVALATGGDDDNNSTAAPPSTSAGGNVGATKECTYRTVPAKGPSAPAPATRQPSSGKPTMTLDTNRGDIVLTLDRSKAPCNVGAVTALADDNFYDSTTCHRLIGANLLVCGSPTGRQDAAPGWMSPDELPTDLAPATTTGSDGTRNVIYPRGTVGILNAPKSERTGDKSVGSGAASFFLTVQDTPLPPDFTIVGAIDPAGLSILDRVAAGGFVPDAPNGNYGRPRMQVVLAHAVVKN